VTFEDGRKGKIGPRSKIRDDAEVLPPSTQWEAAE
jgi:hypothetical protein